MRRHLIALCITLLALSAGAQPADSVTTALRVRLDSVLGQFPILQERTQIGLYVYDLTAEEPLFAFGQHQQLRPASTEKILTAVAALHFLGGDYQLRTTVSVLGRDSVTLLVRGGMDPTITPEDVRQLGLQTKQFGLQDKLHSVALDLSMKDTLRMGPGWCWDDDTKPLCPLLVNGKERFGELFLQALQADTLPATANLRTITSTREAEELRANADTLYVAAERRTSIDRVLLRMMKNSDNNYAESLFYQLGRDAQSAAERITQFLSSIGIDTRTIQVVDGSGLSLYNYSTPDALVRTLRYAYTHPAIYRHLQPTLPVAGYDGTLRRRMRGTAAEQRIMAKTGTLTGVSTLAGYALAPNGHLLAFAIMNQGMRSQRTAHDFQDAICLALCEPIPEPENAEEAPKSAPSMQDPMPRLADPDELLHEDLHSLLAR